MIRVITVDDHPVVRRGLKQIIAAEQDMQVVGEAENAREAIHVIRQTACDAVVLDITLPDASGLDVLSRLRSEHPTLRCHRRYSMNPSCFFSGPSESCRL